mmetsp:Transcript_7189/g.44589  ORF Transcript_7189/g.44589 Transcript_7189/m.44589 type:complete len:270 (-) Transcript_7189:148-957(-)
MQPNLWHFVQFVFPHLDGAFTCHANQNPYPRERRMRFVLSPVLCVSRQIFSIESGNRWMVRHLFFHHVPILRLEHMCLSKDRIVRLPEVRWCSDGVEVPSHQRQHPSFWCSLSTNAAESVLHLSSIVHVFHHLQRTPWKQHLRRHCRVVSDGLSRTHATKHLFHHRKQRRPVVAAIRAFLPVPSREGRLCRFNAFVHGCSASSIRIYNFRHRSRALRTRFFPVPSHVTVLQRRRRTWFGTCRCSNKFATKEQSTMPRAVSLLQEQECMC